MIALVPAGVVEAIGDQVMHAMPAHVAERHRRSRCKNLEAHEAK
jgi:hypothetical protein